jgi:protein-S-isoprenylcysteine O-methyltransferase Ste14
VPLWIARLAVLAANIALIAIRAPHGQRSRAVKTAKSYKGGLERALLALVWLGFFVPLVWLVSPSFAFADYPLQPLPFALGCVLIVLGLWFLQRSHADLGTNWSITLELRENHTLVVHGIYARIRHPMYLALFLHSIGQALVLPNWIAGPAYLVSFGLLFALRVRAEERMMLARFGEQYEAYMARSARLLPGIW